LRENTRYPLSSNIVHGTIHLLIQDGFWVHSVEFVNLSLTESIGESVHNGSFTATNCSDNHESVTYERGLIKLDNLNEPVFNFKKVVVLKKSSDSRFDLFVDFLWNVALFWEDILKQLQEKRNILGNEFGKVHISQGSCHDHLLISAWWFRSLRVTSSSQYGQDVSKTEIIMSLFGKLLLAKFVEDIEFERELNEGIITYRGKLDHDNNLSVRDHHCDTSEKYLQVFWELLSSSITWVHGNEIGAGFDQDNWVLLIWEHEFLKIKFLGLSDRFDLSSDDRESSERDSVELIEATPKS
jgi:hypothetical protein